MTLPQLEIITVKNWLEILSKEWRLRKTAKDKLIVERLLTNYEARYKDLIGEEYQWMTDSEREERWRIHETNHY